jgi:hypothetical protein
MSNDKTRYFSVRIACDVEAVDRFVTDTSKLGRWAQGLRSAAWEPSRTAVGESSAGPIEVCFTDHVDLGICDLSIITPDGRGIECPMRVVRDGAGSEVVFTLRLRRCCRLGGPRAARRGNRGRPQPTRPRDRARLDPIHRASSE